MEHPMIQHVVEYPDEHEVGGSMNMKVEVAYDGVHNNAGGVHSAYRYKHKKRSKVWEEYKPIFLNGKVQFAECLYCHNRLSCKDSNGTSHLWRHQKICPGKPESAERRQKDSYFPYGMSHFPLCSWSTVFS
jgi:hypothetical protein